MPQSVWMDGPSRGIGFSRVVACGARSSGLLSKGGCALHLYGKHREEAHFWCHTKML